MPKDFAIELHHCREDSQRSELLLTWFTNLLNLKDEQEQNIISQYFENIYDFTKKQQFSDTKMACILEIMLYLIRQLLEDTISEEQSFKNFKELLLRHSVQRPPHSLAIFNLDDVKLINEHVQETYYRYYNYYLYALTSRQILQLRTEPLIQVEDPVLDRLEHAKLIPAREIDDLRQFFSYDELMQIEKENEYMLRGPGRIERIMREEMDKLASHMEDRIRKQDEEFLQKVNPTKK
ncbi:UNKNOWN [Stylonychia lemnae]|uniref:Uncharacterized protein n=1 Tax=Stylonychia lemnae TaxID=5949 RepID=A0A077ZZZ7_STYLE|nr:UNKNOWN [Stylonychia lemnae]|eukprot:CDW74773.1 UNKNOWN [Stylonychia lemnae]